MPPSPGAAASIDAVEFELICHSHSYFPSRKNYFVLGSRCLRRVSIVLLWQALRALPRLVSRKKAVFLSYVRPWIQVSEEGIHRPHVAGIAGSAKVSFPQESRVFVVSVWGGGLKSGNLT